MVTLEAAVCGAVELYCIELTGVSFYLFTPIPIKKSYITETPLWIMRYRSTAPQTAYSKIIIQLNHIDIAELLYQAVFARSS